MRNPFSPKKPLLSSHTPRRRHRLLLAILLFSAILLLLFRSPPPAHRPILAPDLSHCLPVNSTSPPLNCCTPLRSPPQIFDFRFPPASSPLRTRPAAHLVDSHYVSQYSRAVQLMKELPSTDPRSFAQQAGIHCAYCDGAYKQLGFSDLEFLIHESWLFFPWHRFFIYFHERILGKLIGNDSFALPFWNWDSPVGMQIPFMYLDIPNISSSSSSSSSSSAFSSPLFHPYRNPLHKPPAMVDLNWNENDGDSFTVEDNLRIMYREMIQNGATAELFLGSTFRAGERAEPGSGSLETIPHNSVHPWVGDPRKNKEDMGVLFSAARDPIFYAHHANIDRLWSVWKSLGRNHKDFSDSDWLDSTFLFYDEEARLVRVQIRDCLDMDRLRYQYQGVENPWIKAGGRPHRTKKKSSGLRDNDAKQVKFPVRLEKEVVVVRVKRPRRRGGGEEVEVLVVEGIETDRTEPTRFDVYVNASPEDLRRPAGRECAGSFVSLPRMRGEGKGKMNLKLGLSELIEDMGAEGDETVAVTIVPRKGKASVAGLSIVWLS